MVSSCKQCETLGACWALRWTYVPSVVDPPVHHLQGTRRSPWPSPPGASSLLPLNPNVGFAGGAIIPVHRSPPPFSPFAWLRQESHVSRGQSEDLHLFQADAHLPSARREAARYRLCRGQLEDHQWLTRKLGRRGTDPAMVADAVAAACGRSMRLDLLVLIRPRLENISNGQARSRQALAHGLGTAH